MINIKDTKDIIDIKDIIYRYTYNIVVYRMNKIKPIAEDY